MKSHLLKIGNIAFCIFLLAACGTRPTPIVSTLTPVPVTLTSLPPTSTLTPTNVPMPSLSIMLEQIPQTDGIRLDQGGDVDTTVVMAGNPPTEAHASGNNQALPGDNSTPDSYLQFNVDDSQLYGGEPTSHVRIEVEYFDQGTDTFQLEYDALPSSGSDGLFKSGGSVVKTNTNAFKAAMFNVCDANFANRDNGADFRISDNGDGAEIIHSVRVTGLPHSEPQTLNVDDYGANPYDDQPDSDAIQSALDSTCSGDTVVFTSGVHDPNYKGYLIDKTVFLTGASSKHDLTFTSSDPNNHALLRATANLKGYVVRSYARSRVSDPGSVDNLDFGNIDVNGGRDVRVCSGADGKDDGKNDNWGSWLPECTQAGDPWCDAGGIGMDGGANWEDTSQNYQGNPSDWTTGIKVHDLVDSQVECGSALAFFSAGGTIQNVTIDTAGDHVHGAGCAFTDNDGDQGGWSDGITLFGPGQTVKDNTIINPSDVGIVFFGGKNTVIANNVVRVLPGNYGAFTGIAVHPWTLGDISGTQVVGNQVTSEGDTNCGGIHAGINLGPQMWGGACVDTSSAAMFGNSGSCSTHPALDQVAACSGGKCQLWAYLPSRSTFTMKDNTVTGAQINYLIDGFAILGQFIDQNNVSQSPQLSDWYAAKHGCNGVTWGALDKAAFNPILPGYTELLIQCER